MAAGSFTLFNVWKQELGQNGGQISSVTFYANLCSASHAVSINDLSSTCITDVVTQSGYAQVTLANVEWSSSVTGTYRMDCDDFAFTTSAVMTPKYCVVTRKVDGKGVAFCNLNTASSSGVDCTQATITVPTSGIYKLSGAGS